MTIALVESDSNILFCRFGVEYQSEADPDSVRVPPLVLDHYAADDRLTSTLEGPGVSDNSRAASSTEDESANMRSSVKRTDGPASTTAPPTSCVLGCRIGAAIALVQGV